MEGNIQNLTVNLGVRYEINWPTTEKYLRFANFDPSARDGSGAIVVPNEASVSAPYLQSSVPLSYPFYQAVHRCLRRMSASMKNIFVLSGYNHFAPRVGIAYRLPRKTVIRTGYGIYWVQLDGNRESEFESVPFLIRESGILNDSFIPTRTIQNFLPAGSSFSQYATLLAHDPAAKDCGYSQQWNFAIQHQFGGAISPRRSLM